MGLSHGIEYGQLASNLLVLAVLATIKSTGASLRIFGMDLGRHPFPIGGRQLLFPALLRVKVSSGWRWSPSRCAPRRS